MNHSRAYAIAESIVNVFADHCHQIEIAGSLRRQKATVKDIEIVARPQLYERTDLFGHVLDHLSLLDTPLDVTEKVRSWERIKDGQRYKQFILPEGINLDLFIVLPPAQWGYIYALRTGPAHFSRWLVTKRMYGGAMPSNAEPRDGGIYMRDELIPMPTETDFFTFLGLDWIDPRDRETFSTTSPPHLRAPGGDPQA